MNPLKRTVGRPRIIEDEGTSVTVNLSKALLSHIDARKGSESRSGYIRMICKSALSGDEAPMHSAEMNMLRDENEKLRKKVDDLSAKLQNGRGNGYVAFDPSNVSPDLNKSLNEEVEFCRSHPDWNQLVSGRCEGLKHNTGVRITPIQYREFVRERIMRWGDTMRIYEIKHPDSPKWIRIGGFGDLVRMIFCIFEAHGKEVDYELQIRYKKKEQSFHYFPPRLGKSPYTIRPKTLKVVRKIVEPIEEFFRERDKKKEDG
jgi:hypothetical protein